METFEDVLKLLAKHQVGRGTQPPLMHASCKHLLVNCCSPTEGANLAQTQKIDNNMLLLQVGVGSTALEAYLMRPTGVRTCACSKLWLNM